MTPVAPRIVNNVSYVTRINREPFFVAGAAFGEVRVSFFVPVQYLLKLNCHFSWQAQYSVKFGMIAGARNVVFFNTKCSW